MRGDFTRATFDKSNHFTRVLMQQGRVQLDADWNEQADILLHYLRCLAADLIGPYAGASLDSFKIVDNGADGFSISPGRYYVDGLLCENDGSSAIPYFKQPQYPLDTNTDTLSKADKFLVYLDVWERHLTYMEQEDADGNVIGMREVALGGPDTASRSQLVWQIKCDATLVSKYSSKQIMSKNYASTVDSLWPEWIQQWQPVNRGLLKAEARNKPADDLKQSTISPKSKYRGAENQLYRVEIHDTGTAFATDTTKDDDKMRRPATFKWSRENGAVLFPIMKLTGNTAVVEHLGREKRFGLQKGDWVEIVDDDITLLGKPGLLAQVLSVNPTTSSVTLAPQSKVLSYSETDTSQKHPLLRRWEQGKESAKREELELQQGAVVLKEGKWIMLEDGVQINFQPSDSGALPNRYRTGDYWLIPARTATGDIEWPGQAGAPKAMPPHGIEHHYAPLAIVTATSSTMKVIKDLRRIIAPISCPS